MRLALALVTLLAGCSTAVAGTPVASSMRDEDLIAKYFTAFDKSAEDGPDAQGDFLRRTQHPDFTSRICELNGATVTVEPALATLRPDPKWAPEGGQQPRGQVYVVAVSLTIQRDGQRLGQQIGSNRIVVLNGMVYGFMPCFRQR